MGLKDLRRGAPENLVWEARGLSFLSHILITFLTMRSSILIFPRWKKTVLQYDSQQRVTIRKIQEMERQTCRLVFVENGLSVGRLRN